MRGKVTLVGAGPGDEGLITVKGKEALLNAEVVVFDRLVGEGILALIPENAEKIDAGKASSNHKIPQEEINKILLEKALEGKNVVRLKGGDCYLFGRGGEELELLYENDIDFCVIPGITSALAAAAYAGIPITHRDFASSVHIITGHARAGKQLDIDFGAYARTKGTLVFLMGVANMKYIAGGLIDGGMDRKTPCAVIERGTTWGQKKYIGTLENITEIAKEAKSPAIIVVGYVCGLNSKYDWFSRQPLFGKSIVVTRPKERIGTLSDKLRKKGAHVIECPCISLKSLMDKELSEKVWSEIKQSDVVVFTSPTGVNAVMQGLLSTGADARVFGGARLAAIGSATSGEFLKYGLCADYVPENYSGADLGTLLVKSCRENERLLLLRAEVSSRGLNRIIEEAGLRYKELAVYRTEENSAVDLTEEINSGKVDYVTFTSASTVRGFMRGHKNIDTDKFCGVCIGSATAEEAEGYGIKYIVSEKAELDSLVKAIEERA
ncbi:MAG: uroporphyrinogen-III C-methyltransferase [Candidatus Ornithomonoglobus sp.]